MMKKGAALLLIIALLFSMPIGNAEASIQQETLIGLWHFCGGAEVIGYGFYLHGDGSATLYDTDEYASFPPRRLIERQTECTWMLKDNTLIFTFPERKHYYPLTFTSGTAEYSGKDTLHLGEDDSGGFFQRCEGDVTIVPCGAVPDGVLAAASLYEDHLIEGYLEIPGTPGGDYAFLLIKSSEERKMLCFRLDEFGWSLYFTADKAIPQAELHCSFIYEEKGLTYQRLWDDENKYEYTADGLGFGVYTDDGVIYMEGISFAWQDGGFRLTNYQDSPGRQMDYLDGQLIFYNIGDGFESAHPAAIETALEKMDFYALPRSPEEITAPKALTILPKSMDCILTGKKMAFTKGKRCPVYMGPGKEYGQAGNGKAVASTNDWIEVYGERDGWLLIRYELSKGKYRIGWIENTHLKKGQIVQHLQFEDTLIFIPRSDCSLTDDPTRDSPPEILRIPHGTEIKLLAMLDENWCYVQLQLNGRIWMGFI